MATLEEIRLFHSSIFSINIDPEADLVSIAKELEASGKAKTVASNAGGWQSEKQHYGSIEEIQPFLDKVLTFVNKIYEEYSVHKAAVLTEYWFNVNRNKDFNWLHNHPHCYFSAVFYIKQLENSGNIVFERTDPLNDWVKFKSINDRNGQTVTVRPTVNNLIIFPSYLKHRVGPNHTDEDRISMAFNFK